MWSPHVNVSTSAQHEWERIHIARLTRQLLRHVCVAWSIKMVFKAQENGRFTRYARKSTLLSAYNVTLWRVRVTIFAIETHKFAPFVSFKYKQPSAIWVFGAAMKMQRCLPCTLFSRNKIFRNAVKKGYVVRSNPECLGFDSRWCQLNFSLTQPLTEMSTRNISWR